MMKTKETVLFSSPKSINLFSLYIFLVMVFLAHPSCASLAYNFYAASCPAAEIIISNTVRAASSTDPTVPGKLLRLLFHDCVVEGCDASVLLQGNNTERSDPANASLGGFSVIDSAKRELEIFCPRTVSCADIVALAARDSVAITGGPVFHIPKGRRDGRVSSAANVRPNIIDTSFTVDDMIRIFSSKGLSVDDVVILSGAHTIGSAHCNAFNDRFKSDPAGKLKLIDTSLDSSYANELMQKCSTPSLTVNNDPQTSFVFDNQYYRNLVAHKGLFQSDSVLFNDNRTRKLVEDFANEQESFFAKWVESFVKLSIVGAKVDDEGEIREVCSSRVNG